MDIFLKFIIETDSEEGDCLIVSKCTFHKQLAVDTDNVKGGGWWELDEETMTITLYGNSNDFGSPELDDIKSCIDRKKVFTNSSLCNYLGDRFNFQYRKGNGEIIKLN